MNLFKTRKAFVSIIGASVLTVFYACGGKGGDGGGSEVGVPIPMEGAKITGTIKFKGAKPGLATVDMSPEPVCVKKWKDKGEKPKSQALVLGAGNTVANVIVYVKTGLKKVRYAPPKEPVVVDQNGCSYNPHAFAVMKGQTVLFKNSDGILHNVNLGTKINPAKNLAMTPNMKELKHKFIKAEAAFSVTCQVHSWMKSSAAVFDHPFFAVTGLDGKFEIKGLPPGVYEIEAWHEKMPAQTAKVTLAAKETKSQNFTFSK